MAQVDIADTVELDEGGAPVPAEPVEDPGAEQATPAPVIHEAEDDEAGEGLELVRTGWVRLRIRDGETGEVRRWRLRAPSLREFKRMRLALEEVEDEVGALRTVFLAKAGKVAAEMAEARKLPDPEGTERLVELGRQERKLTAEFTDAHETLRVQWLHSVFTERYGRGAALGVDGVPHEDDWPSWVTSPDFYGQLLNHWRHVPLAPGR